MTTYERVRYRPEDGRARSIILANPRETTLAGAEVLTGVEVDREGDEVAPRGVDERRHIIEMALVVTRTPLMMDNAYGVLVTKGDRCSQCGTRVYGRPGSWSDRADGTDTLGSGEVCMAGPNLTHNVSPK